MTPEAGERAGGECESRRQYQSIIQHRCRNAGANGQRKDYPSSVLRNQVNSTDRVWSPCRCSAVLPAVVPPAFIFNNLGVRVPDDLNPGPLTSIDPPAGEEVLSDREAEVLRRIALGYSNREISCDLVVSIKTVETYKARAMKKAGIRSRVELIRYASRQGWLTGL